LNWNDVPVELDSCSNLAGTGVQLSSTKAGAENAHYKSLSGEVWKMAFGGREGELVAVIGCGMKSLDRAK